jgi:orotate phosphoribosyltransferase
MTNTQALKIFKQENAFLSGHFLLSSGLHSPNYMQCALVLQKPWVAQKLCKALAVKLKKIKVDVVVGPAMGGIIVAYELGRALKKRSIFVERVDGQFALRRGFSLEKNDRVLVVEDVVTTGKSSLEVIELLKQQGCRLAGVASLVDRSEGKASFGAPFVPLFGVDIKTYKPEECPLCKEGKIPAIKPGSRGLR